MKKTFALLGLFSVSVACAQTLVVFDGKEKKSGGGWGDPATSVTLGVADDVQFEGGSTLQFKATCANWWGGGGWNWKNWAKEGDDISSYDYIAFFVRKSSGDLLDLRVQLADAENTGSSTVDLVKDGYASAIGGEFTKVMIPLQVFTGEFNKQRAACLNVSLVPVTANGSATVYFGKIEFGKGEVPAPVKPDPAKAAVSKVSGNPAAIPTKSPDDWKKWPVIAHKARAEQGNINVLFIGDSITELWNDKSAGLDAWNATFEPMGAAQFGISGDTTQEILWRISEGGELDLVQPKVIIYLGGVNNTFTGETVDNTAGGIKATLDYLQKRLPESKIILLGLLPNGFTADNVFRVKNAAVNDKICHFADNQSIFYLDLGSKFINADGSLKKEAFRDDGVHPCALGYETFAANLKPEVEKLLGAAGQTQAPAQSRMIFDGKGRKTGGGWADPAGCSLGVSDAVMYQGGSTLEFKAAWTDWWAGGGWNWRNYAQPGDDISHFTYLTFMIKEGSGDLADLWIQLVDSNNKVSEQLKLFDTGCISELGPNFVQATIPLSSIKGDFNRKSVWGISFGAVPKTQVGDCTLYIADMGFNSNPVPRQEDLALPEGVVADWELNSAWRQTSQTREAICLNALWRFMPSFAGGASQPPAEGSGWGWFKVPGIWPKSDSLTSQKFMLPAFYNRSQVAKMESAWYKRTVNVPESWKGRSISLDFDLVQTQAEVFIDGNKAGEVAFPGGKIDITDKVVFGRRQEIAILVTARPMDIESNVFMAPDRIVKGSADLKLRGITGDLYLISEPMQNLVDDVRVETSTRKGTITFDIGFAKILPRKLLIEAEILKAGKQVKTFAFAPVGVDAEKGRVVVSAEWKDAALWDTDTPGNLYEAVLTLRDADSNAMVDQTLPITFGFREFWIEGRDFYLNGSKIHLRLLGLDNAGSGADQASKEGSLRTLEKLKKFGFNAFIFGNYSFKPGEIGYLQGLLEAVDESGTLCAFSLPHFNDYGRKLTDPAVAENYRKLCAYLIRKVQNHPAVVLYAMNHNAMGYSGDQNCQKIDGLWEPDAAAVNPEGYFFKSREQGEIAESIATTLDPSRPLYHHESGNFSQMHTVNIYLNWAPRQERSDWLEHWASVGVKPVFFVEWGMPHVASWSSFRGPEFIWTSLAMHKIWDSEFAAPILGEKAYQMTPRKIELLEREMGLWAAGKPFGYWEIVQNIQRLESNYSDVQAWYMSDNLRSHRTWGISAFLPWDQGDLWKRVKQTPTVENPVRFKNLNAPGIVADTFVAGLSFLEDPSDDAFEPASTGKVLQKWNMPLMAFIGGAPVFSDKTHNYRAGAEVSKQLVVLNDTRRTTTCKYAWTVKGAGSEQGQVTVKPGEKVFVPISFKMPSTDPTCTVYARFDFGDGHVSEDEFTLDVIGPLSTTKPLVGKVVLYDPKGLSAPVLKAANIPFTAIASLADAGQGGILVIGREAFDRAYGATLRLDDLKGWSKILVLEQNYDTLVNRLGFRATELGVREVFVRTPSHPVLQGLSERALCNWTGDSTLVVPFLDLPNQEKGDPEWLWCGFTNRRVWRCGNRNAVASVIIEKPPRGNWLPLLDCGFDLQYSPLLEYSDATSRMIFCQMNLSGRTVDEPAATQLLGNLLRYLDTAKKPAFRPVYYTGDERGRQLLADLGVKFEDAKLAGTGAPNSLLVLGPKPVLENLHSLIESVGHVLAIGLNGSELDAVFPGEFQAEQRKTVSFVDKYLQVDPQWRGISNAELHWRMFPEIAALKPSGNSQNPALRVFRHRKGVFVASQAAPWDFDTVAKPYVRTTYRRNVFLISRLLANSGAEMYAPLREFFTLPPTLMYQDLSKGWKMADEAGLVNAVETCSQPEFNDDAWKTVDLPSSFTQLGACWYRLKFTVEKGFPEDVTLSLGPCDDESEVWLNGKFLGEISKKTHPQDYYCHPRDYRLPKELINSGESNTIAVRVNNTYLEGSMSGKPALTTKGVWQNSYYLQTPEQDDDPYRYYRW